MPVPGTVPVSASVQVKPILPPTGTTVIHDVNWTPVLVVQLTSKLVQLAIEKLISPLQSNKLRVWKLMVPQPKVTDVCVDVCVEPLPDVAVHALVIPDVPPTPSHPWSWLVSVWTLMPRLVTCPLLSRFANTCPLPSVPTTKSATNDVIITKRDACHSVVSYLRTLLCYICGSSHQVLKI